MCCEFRNEKLNRRLLSALTDIVVYMMTNIHNNEKYQTILVLVINQLNAQNLLL